MYLKVSLVNDIFQYQNVFTLAPNSTRFAKFCTDLATNISVLAAIGDGESVRENWAPVMTLTPKALSGKAVQS